MRYRVLEHVLARAVHDEVMILDTRSDEFLGLNATGAAVWDVLIAGRPVAEAIDGLVENFDVARDTAEKDVAALLENLQRLGVISPLGT